MRDQGRRVDGAALEGESMKRYFKIGALVILLAVLVTFALENEAPVRLRYYFGWISGALPFYSWIYLSLFSGILIGIAVCYPGKRTLRKTVKGLSRENEALKEKLVAGRVPDGS